MATHIHTQAWFYMHLAVMKPITVLNKCFNSIDSVRLTSVWFGPLPCPVIKYQYRRVCSTAAVHSIPESGHPVTSCVLGSS